MKKTQLSKVLKRLSQGASEAVQSGNGLDEFGNYMHVVRSVELELKEKMNLLNKMGGGLILLTGSSGDGKSHLLSRIIQDDLDHNFDDFQIYNDATESASPTETSIDTLKRNLVSFNNSNLGQTNDKMVLAINMGKVVEFVSDDEVKTDYAETICLVANDLLGESKLKTNSKELLPKRIMVVNLAEHQLFSFDKSNSVGVSSSFFKDILEKITKKTDDNPFYLAYKKTKQLQMNETLSDPVVVNYELLSMPNVQDSLIQILIESIVTFEVIVTPRKFLDFIYSIMVYESDKKYVYNSDFIKRLLPSLLFDGTKNLLQKEVSKLDPMKTRSRDKDTYITQLYATNDFDSIFNKTIYSNIQCRDELKNFFSTNSSSADGIIGLLTRLEFLSSYTPSNLVYKKYIDLLSQYWHEEKSVKLDLYDLFHQAITRHHGAYVKDNLVPLGIQGRKYKLFCKVKYYLETTAHLIDENAPNKFNLDMLLKWKIGSGSDTPNVYIKLDFNLFDYLFKIKKSGKLSTIYERNLHMGLNHFIAKIIKYSNDDEVIYIVDSNNNKYTLSENREMDFIQIES